MFAYTAAGTAALRAGTMQRCFRDMHAGTQHMTSAPPARQSVGRQLLGPRPGHALAVPDARRGRLSTQP